MQDEIQLIAKRGAGKAFNPKDHRRKLKSLPNPLTAVFGGLAGEVVSTAQIAPTDASLHSVKPLRDRRIRDFITRPTRNGLDRWPLE